MTVSAPVGRGASLVFSCEHGGREVPDRYVALFESSAAQAALASHRGWDPGAADLAAVLSREVGAPLAVLRTTRLLVEANRSVGHPQLWSEFSKSLPVAEKESILDRYWRPHREAVRQMVAGSRPGPVIHVSVHSFTPVWHGRRRSTDIGLLYDPARAFESRVVADWRSNLLAHAGSRGLDVHRNRPYRGWTDGLTTALRREMPEERYAGIELEVSQALMPASSSLADALAEGLSDAVRRLAG